MITPLAVQANIVNAIQLLVDDLSEVATWEAIASRASGRFAAALVTQLSDVPNTEASRILTNLIHALHMSERPQQILADAVMEARQYLARQS